MTDKVQTTKVCPDCGNDALGKFPSMNLKWCANCRKYIPWNLDPGQKPLVESSRDRGMSNEH